ncbi:MAG: hypothetical protein ABI577_15645, partial [bacterium]
MGVFSELGLHAPDGPIMCVAAPDSVLAEASLMKPRPSFASTLLTAEPTARLVWWPEVVHLEDRFMARLQWLLATSGGKAWLVIDPRDEDAPLSSALVEALQRSGLVVGDAVTINSGESA